MVSWNALADNELGSSPLESYFIGITDVEGANTESEVEISAQAIYHTFENVVPGEAYTFRIRAKNLVGYSAWSAATESLFPGVEPTRPGMITFTSTTRTTISFTLAILTG